MRARTRLYERRRAAGLSQRRLAQLTGISLRTLQRIERLEVDNPPLRYLTNCAIALGCDFEDLIELRGGSGRCSTTAHDGRRDRPERADLFDLSTDSQDRLRRPLSRSSP